MTQVRGFVYLVYKIETIRSVVSVPTASGAVVSGELITLGGAPLTVASDTPTVVGTSDFHVLNTVTRDRGNNVVMTPVVVSADLTTGNRHAHIGSIGFRSSNCSGCSEEKCSSESFEVFHGCLFEVV